MTMVGGPPSKELQRSRHPKTAESRVRNLNLADNRNASTEPPSEDGGEGLASISNVALLVASTEPPSEDGGESTMDWLDRVRMTRFNGAAIRRRRRGLRAPGAEPIVYEASTEPPSEDGGESSSPRT